MDNIEHAYFSMFQNQNNQQKLPIDSIDHIQSQLNNHIRYFFPILSIQQQKLLHLILTQDLPINITCIDKVHFKFQLNFGSEKFIFFCIPNNLISFMQNKRNPILKFYSGPIDNPNINQIFLIFKSLPLKKSYIKNRIKYFKQLEKQQENLNKPQQENINTIFFQYMQYFRNK